ncbi:MAG: hypothetical protein H6811_03560 [Phycisphaeraceae bacterium]|nr:hypothetical protein [Phycisphaeraceae bacterium]
MWGFLFRWGMVIGGAAMVVSGANELLFGDRVEETAREVSAHEAGTLARSGEPSFVHVAGEIDLSRRIFESGLKTPRFVTDDPGETYVLDPVGMGERDLASFVGLTVIVSGALDGRLGSMTVTEKKKGDRSDPGVLRSIRSVATLVGAEGRVYFMSPRFMSEEDDGYDAWHARTSFTGKVCRVSDFAANRSEIGHSGQDISRVFLEHGIMTAPDAVIILTDWPEAVARTSYAPIAGTDNGVLVSIPPGGEPAADGATGVVRQASARTLDGVEGSFGPMTESIVLIDTGRTGEEFNQRAVASGKFGLFFGLTQCALGGAWVLSVRRKKRVRAEALARELEHMALLAEVVEQGRAQQAAGPMSERRAA